MKRILTVVVLAVLFVVVAAPAYAAGPIQAQVGNTFGPGECADGDQTATREQLRECDGPLAGDCTQAQVQTQEQARTQERASAGPQYGETTVQAGQLRLQERDMLQDGTGDGEPDQTRSTVQDGADEGPENGLEARFASFVRRIAERFAHLFGRA